MEARTTPLKKIILTRNQLPRYRQHRLLPACRREGAVLQGLHLNRQQPQYPCHPHTLQLIINSLRYWVLEMHIDGFWLDLASTLAREFYDVNRLSAFFNLVQQDPVVN